MFWKVLTGRVGCGRRVSHMSRLTGLLGGSGGEQGDVRGSLGPGLVSTVGNGETPQEAVTAEARRRWWRPGLRGHRGRGPGLSVDARRQGRGMGLETVLGTCTRHWITDLVTQ